MQLIRSSKQAITKLFRPTVSCIMSSYCIRYTVNEVVLSCWGHVGRPSDFLLGVVDRTVLASIDARTSTSSYSCSTTTQILHTPPFHETPHLQEPSNSYRVSHCFHAFTCARSPVLARRRLCSLAFSTSSWLLHCNRLTRQYNRAKHNKNHRNQPPQGRGRKQLGTGSNAPLRQRTRFTASLPASGVNISLSFCQRYKRAVKSTL
jgi:hypothetical protein